MAKSEVVIDISISKKDPTKLVESIEDLDIRVLETKNGQRSR